MKRQAKCHPLLKEAAKGLCHTCYDRQSFETDPTKKVRQLELRKIRRLSRPDKILPEDRKNSHRRSRYGISSEDYEKMLEEQNNLCAICQLSFHKDLYIDHDHKTNKVRQLLCARCNTLVGFLEKNPESVRRAEKYIERHK